MSEEPINLDSLAKPFDVDKVHWRVGAMTKDKTSCIALAYVDARDVMQRLDEVVGRGSWPGDAGLPMGLPWYMVRPCVIYAGRLICCFMLYFALFTYAFIPAPGCNFMVLIWLNL